MSPRSPSRGRSTCSTPFRAAPTSTSPSASTGGEIRGCAARALAGRRRRAGSGDAAPADRLAAADSGLRAADARRAAPPLDGRRGARPRARRPWCGTSPGVVTPRGSRSSPTASTRCPRRRPRMGFLSATRCCSARCRSASARRRPSPRSLAGSQVAPVVVGGFDGTAAERASFERAVAAAGGRWLGDLDRPGPRCARCCAARRRWCTSAARRARAWRCWRRSPRARR